MLNRDHSRLLRDRELWEGFVCLLVYQTKKFEEHWPFCLVLLLRRWRSMEGIFLQALRLLTQRMACRLIHWVGSRIWARKRGWKKMVLGHRREAENFLSHFPRLNPVPHPFSFPILVLLGISIKKTNQKGRFSSLLEVLGKISLFVYFTPFGVKESCYSWTYCQSFLYC